MVGVRLAIGATVAAVLLAAAPGDAAPKPTLTLVQTRPVKVRAAGFEPRETVRLSVRAGDGVTRATTTADRDGRFVATVHGAVVSRCATLRISATGADGSHAVLRRSPQCPVRDG